MPLRIFRNNLKISTKKTKEIFVIFITLTPLLLLAEITRAKFVFPIQLTVSRKGPNQGPATYNKSIHVIKDSRFVLHIIRYC